jgi:phosphatidylglycerophosphate synthase
MDNTSENRRPLTSRDTGWAKATATFLARNNVSPNFISILSMVFAALALAAFYFDYKGIGYHPLNMILAIAGIQLRLLMNLLDGMVAIEHNKKSAVGGLYNEVPDRVSDTLIIFGAGLLAKNYRYGMDLAYLAIIISLATAYIRALGASLNCGHFFLGPMAKPHRMAFICLGCIVAIWDRQIFYYLFMVMNVGLIITCYRRLAKIAATLKSNA